ncbi:HAD-IIA family hydrolase [Streptomyces sp. NPDC047024]|uniref:HAD-IIA family hydrolase n=1 Tax=Streptomyces sp. NPDC047024 TaxID=3155476 RepID=UPI0033E9FAFD
MRGVRGVLVDIDGVLTVSWRALPGAVEALRVLRDGGLGVVLVTNTTSRTRVSVAAALAGAGFAVDADDILTATAAHLAGARCALLNSGDIEEDLAGITLVDEDGEDGEDDSDAPDVVLVGGAGPEFSYAAVNRAFSHLRRGARLVALHRNLTWRTDAGLQLDAGAYIAGLEAAAGTEAEVTGKPSAAFFRAALDRLGVDAAEAVMVGDDVESDVLGAQRLGITGVLVRTGKFQPDTLDRASGTPDHVVDSFADVPALLGLTP